MRKYLNSKVLRIISVVLVVFYLWVVGNFMVGCNLEMGVTSVANVQELSNAPKVSSPFKRCVGAFIVGTVEFVKLPITLTMDTIELFNINTGRSITPVKSKSISP